MACEDPNCNCNTSIKMDGSGGVGDLARITITRTDDIQGEIEEVFVVPYLLVHFNVLQAFLQLRQISGYAVKRLPKSVEGQ